MSLFMVIFPALLLVPDAVIWWLFVRVPAGPWLNIAWWIPSAAACIIFAAWYFCEDYMLLRIFFAIYMCAAMPKFIFFLFALAGKGTGIWHPAAGAAIVKAGVVAAIACAACALYGLTRGLKRLEVRHADIVSPALPAEFDGYRIVHFSDIHLGTYGGDTTFTRKIVETINAQHPDIILFTGDLVNFSPGETAGHSAILARLDAPDSVYSVMGNHDYCIYGPPETLPQEQRTSAVDRLAESQRFMGWHLLRNEHAIITRGTAQIAVAGVDNTGKAPFFSLGQLSKAVDGIPRGTYTILLTHDPSHWRGEVLETTDVDLTLSGHTHAMQFQIFGFSPSAWMYPEWGGLYCEGGRMLHVSKGTGGTAPFRFGAWPEITVLTLRKSR